MRGELGVTGVRADTVPSSDPIWTTYPTTSIPNSRNKHFASDPAANGTPLSPLAPGLIAWLLGYVAIGLAFLMSARRMLAYGVVLIAGGIWTAQLNASPGWPLLAAGTVVTVTGIAMLIRFIRNNPVVGQP